MDSKILAAKIRWHALNMTSRAGSSHIASVFSVADIVAVLYASVLKVDPQRPAWDDRDRFILSKGHAGAAVYGALAEMGFFSTTMLEGFYQDGSVLSGHVSHHGIPGVELSTGSLGHGLGVAAGMAKALQMKGKKSRVVVVLSDGECDEGTIWEATLFAQHHGLSNLLVVVDYNKIQSLAPVAETIALEPFRAKWEAFNWTVREADGHNHDALQDAFGAARDERPQVVIAHTTKGRGVSFMENSVLWHYRTARGDELTKALNELNGS